MSRVTGHTLREEGRAMSGRGCEEGACASDAPTNPRRREGHGECSCGAQSPHLTTLRGRQAWHREHKAGVVLPEAKAGQRWRSKRDPSRVIELVSWRESRREWNATVVRRQHGGRRATYLLPETLASSYELVPEPLPGQPPAG